MNESLGRAESRDENPSGAGGELSIALRYLPGIDEAPLVLVSGQGEIARSIVLLARSLRIPVVRDEDLSHKLLRVPPGHPIPVELYEAVAVILAVLARDKVGGEEC
ncbi:MAG: EscU/YscU/HrcU family type III secretion system export apparatus switch protein [Nitrospiraceae bacterium]|nr:EscU/YscU/HrcU family type III secretion system export apparatus switch protein [Nitrospiraceae bacterium]